MSNFTIGETDILTAVTSPEDDADALACLIRHDAGDLALMLGLA